jgi:hypothetical protein
MVMVIWLVVWNHGILWLSIQLGMSSPQLTNSYFSEGFVNHQPVKMMCWEHVNSCDEHLVPSVCVCLKIVSVSSKRQFWMMINQWNISFSDEPWQTHLSVPNDTFDYRSPTSSTAIAVMLNIIAWIQTSGCFTLFNAVYPVDIEHQWHKFSCSLTNMNPNWKGETKEPWLHRLQHWKTKVRHSESRPSRN